jgi:hypothetical protein
MLFFVLVFPNSLLHQNRLSEAGSALGAFVAGLRREALPKR